MTGPRAKLSWSDLAGARVGVWGLGREGHANLRKLASLGVEPVLVDDRLPARSRWQPESCRCSPPARAGSPPWNSATWW